MLRPVTTKRFEKDLKLMKKRGKNLSKLKEALELLIEEKPLPLKYHDHWLSGNYSNRRECHLEPDWLLIYFPQKNEIVFERTGSHSDLF